MRTFSRAAPRRPLDRRVGRVPHTKAMCRLRALVLMGTAAVAVSGVVRAATDSPGEQVSASGGSTPPARPAPPDRAPVITRIETGDPVVFLTIDDGHTRSPELVEALGELGVPVTLFLVDQPIARGADFFRSLPGAVVEAHGQTHTSLRGLPEHRQRAEICGNAGTIERAFGRRPMLFRPPYGNYDQATRQAAASCGMAAVVLWEATVDGGRISHRHVPELRPGDIVLLHFRPRLVDELRLVVERIEAAGLRVGLLEEYLVPETLSEPG